MEGKGLVVEVYSIKGISIFSISTFQDFSDNVPEFDDVLAQDLDLHGMSRELKFAEGTHAHEVNVLKLLPTTTV